MDADDVGLGQQLLEGAHPPGVAVGQPVGGVVEDDPHPDGLSHVRELRADVAVADDAQGAAADLVAPLGRLVPDAVVHPLRLLGQAAGQRQDLAQHQLDDTAGVGERRVEDGDPARGRVDEVHLVGADAEAAHGEEVLSRVQGTGRHLGVRPDAEQRHAGQGVDQLALTQRPRPGLDLEPLTSQGFRGNRVDVLQQQSFHSSNLRLDLTDRPPDDCPVTLEVGYAGVRRSASGLTARAPRWPWAQSRNGPHWRGGLEFEGARNVCPEGDLSVRYTRPDHRPNLTLGPL